MRVLSLDMSTKKTGWAILENGKLQDFGLIEAKDKDITVRTMKMYFGIQELIENNKIDNIICEDVPVATHSNLEVGKDLCVLQGCILVAATTHNLKLETRKPTDWRAKVGLNHSLYECKKCGYKIEDISGLDFPCPQCGAKKSNMSKKALNERVMLKRRAVNMANEKYNLNLQYYQDRSDKNDDDIAEAILIGLAFFERNE